MDAMSEKPLLTLDWCSYAAAKYAVQHWHYSKAMPTPPLVKIGCWEDTQFIGCILFGRGTNKNLCRAYRLSITEVCELTRVALTRHDAPVSRLIRIALRLLTVSSSRLRLVVSYADPNYGITVAFIKHWGGFMMDKRRQIL
jgi:hypothetical protein